MSVCRSVSSALMDLDSSRSHRFRLLLDTRARLLLLMDSGVHESAFFSRLIEAPATNKDYFSMMHIQTLYVLATSIESFYRV